MRGIFVRLCFVGVIQASNAVAAAASPTETASFYAGKQINFVVGTPPGGGNDLYARVLAQFLPRHIPGNPSIIVQNMSGAGGITAASYVFNIAAKDGTVIATSPAGMLLSEALEPAQTHFESRKFAWIGTVATTTDVLAVFKSAGVNTLQDAKQTEVRIGGADLFSLSTLEPAIANAMIGTKFHIIMGYGGGDTMDLAMEQHEIDGRTNQWASWKVLRPSWISNSLLSYLLQFGPKSHDLPSSVPEFKQLVSTPEDSAIIDLLELPQYMGRSVFAPPGIPDERLHTLQQAFDVTMHDPAFVDKMHELNLELDPRKPNEFQDALQRVMSNSSDTVRAMKAMLKVN